MDVVHDAANRRFSATVDGYDCEIDYRFADGVMTITHTGVPSPIGGRGIAGMLTQFAMDQKMVPRKYSVEELFAPLN